jgi:hypothetical protein
MKHFTIVFIAVMLFAVTSISFAQINWTKHPNPILGPGPSGAWDDSNVSLACVILFNDTLHMWYDGNWDNIGSVNSGIGHATSVDGINWDKDTLNPVLTPGPANWDSYVVSQAAVLFNTSDSLFHMWYMAIASVNGPLYIGHATSPTPNGRYWTKDANPALSPGSSWDSYGPNSPTVVLVDDTLHLWYAGFQIGTNWVRIGHATSTNWMSWQKDPANPVLNPGSVQDWDYLRVWCSKVIYDGFRFHLFYTAGGTFPNKKTGYAYSEDGRNWTKYNNYTTITNPYANSDPVLVEGPAGSWDDHGVWTGSVLFNDTGDSLRMWYSGISNGILTANIGYATAPVSIIHVPNQYATIQEAIDAAEDGNVILVEEGTYYENINFKGKAITVASHFWFDSDTSHISNTIIDGSQPSNPDSGSVVYMVSGEDTTSVLMGLTITNGSGTKIKYTYQGNIMDARAGGGILLLGNSGGRFVRNKIINNTISSENQAVGGGLGSACFGSNPYIILKHNQIKNNTINGIKIATGGGITITSDGRIIGNNISYNSCISTTKEATGGGVRIAGEQNSPCTVLIQNNRINHNLAKGLGTESPYYLGALGGGLFNAFCMVFVNDNTISYNQLSEQSSSSASGGGIYMYPATSGCVVSRNTISHNTVNSTMTNYGGAISMATCNFPVYNNVIFGNTADRGGGIYLLNTTPEIINNTIVNNEAAYRGGGLFSDNSNPVILNTIIYGNIDPVSSQIYGTARVRYSDIQGGYTGEGNIDADPQFVAGDSLCHLTPDPSNPCVNSGIDSIEINGRWYYCPPDDYEGDERPFQGIAADMGSDETQVPVGIEQQPDAGIPQSYALEQNYPNPFNPTTSIEFSIPKSEFVTLKVYNILGEEVATLVAERLPAGKYKYDWDAGSLASGVYLYRIQTGTYVDSKKMVLLR